MIESFSFGQTVIDGRTYHLDLIIFPDGRIQSSWWRKNGHQLVLEDIANLIDAKPDTIVVGTGTNGFMKPDPELVRRMQTKGIKLVIEPTSKAVETYNALEGKSQVAACFHVGC